jgi:hypothetical protein
MMAQLSNHLRPAGWNAGLHRSPDAEAVSRDSPMTGTEVDELLQGVHTVRHGAVGSDHYWHVRIVEAGPFAAALARGIRWQGWRASQPALGGLVVEAEVLHSEYVKNAGRGRSSSVSVDNRQHREFCPGCGRGGLNGRTTSNAATPSEAPTLLKLPIKECQGAPVIFSSEVAARGPWTIVQLSVGGVEVTGQSIHLWVSRLEG